MDVPVILNLQDIPISTHTHISLKHHHLTAKFQVRKPRVAHQTLSRQIRDHVSVAISTFYCRLLILSMTWLQIYASLYII